jgi:hypothetical protein
MADLDLAPSDLDGIWQEDLRPGEINLQRDASG